jgi:hypothetical protein
MVEHSLTGHKDQATSLPQRPLVGQINCLCSNFKQGGRIHENVVISEMHFLELTSSQINQKRIKNKEKKPEK